MEHIPIPSSGSQLDSKLLRNLMEILLHKTLQAATVNINDTFKMKMTLMFWKRTKGPSVGQEWDYPLTVIMAVPGLDQDYKSTVEI